MDNPEPLEAVLCQLARDLQSDIPWWGEDRLCVLGENQGCCIWYVLLDGDDPPVFMDPYYDQYQEDPADIPAPEKVAERFSEFLFDWFAGFYSRDWTPLSERSPYPHLRTRPERDKPHLNGLWLYAPEAEPVAPPCIDYLIDHLAEGPRIEVTPEVMQYHFKDEHGGIRVTTDCYGEEGGVSAWWLHSDSEEALYRLAREACSCGNLLAALRHWNTTARSVLNRLRDEEGR
jgi:hypothetical protein